MAFEVDVSESLDADGVVHGPTKTRDPLKLRFEPMRRKLDIAVDA